MTPIAIFREGTKICAMLGPDLVRGVGGFGETPADAVRDLADGFDQHGYELRDGVSVEVAGVAIQETAGPDTKPSDAIRALAGRLEQGGYNLDDFPEPDWGRIGREESLVHGH